MHVVYVDSKTSGKLGESAELPELRESVKFSYFGTNREVTGRVKSITKIDDDTSFVFLNKVKNCPWNDGRVIPPLILEQEEKVSPDLQPDPEDEEEEEEYYEEEIEDDEDYEEDVEDEEEFEEYREDYEDEDDEIEYLEDYPDDEYEDYYDEEEEEEPKDLYDELGFGDED